MAQVPACIYEVNYIYQFGSIEFSDWEEVHFLPDLSIMEVLTIEDGETVSGKIVYEWYRHIDKLTGRA